MIEKAVETIEISGWNFLNSFIFLMVILFILYIFKKGDDE